MSTKSGSTKVGTFLVLYRYIPIMYIDTFYDKDAPTKVGAIQIPSLVRILWTLLVAGLTHAASLVSRVVKPVDTEILIGKKSLDKDNTMMRTGLDGLKYFLLGIHLRYRLGI